MACLSRRVPEALAKRVMATTPREKLFAQMVVCERFFMVKPSVPGIGGAMRRIVRQASGEQTVRD
jgi:hypothetical protein